jgi:uncharacterized membrane protein YbhN (UPF0104 family)
MPGVVFFQAGSNLKIEIRKVLWWALGVVVSVFILGILINRLDAQAVIGQMAGAWMLPLALSLFISLVANIGLSSWQWRTVYDEIGYSIPVEEHAFVKLALYPLRAALPLRTGDLGRAVYLSAQHRVPVALGVAAHGLILIINVTILLYLSIIGFLGAGHIMLSAMTFILLCGIIIGVVVGRNFLVRAQTAEAKRAGWFERQLHKMRPVAGLSFNSLLPITLLGLVTLLAQVVSFSLIATALDVPIPPEKIFTYTPIIMLAGSLPFTFMGLGVREWAAIRLLAPFAGPETLLSMGVLFSAIDQVIFAFIGLIVLPPFIKACRIKDWPGIKEW